MVLAAGLGTRLLPLTEELPKAVVPVLNRPIGAYALEHLAHYGIRRAVVNTHHMHTLVSERLGAVAPARLDLAFLHEEDLLGTAGGVRNARSLLLEGETECVIVNADMLFAPDLNDALRVHRDTGAIATMIVRPNPDPSQYGPVEVDDQGRVRRLLGDPQLVATRLRLFMFTGVHILSARAFDDLPERGCIVRTAYREWLRRGEVVSSVVDLAPWRDVGNVRAYLDANLELLTTPVLIHESAHVPPSAKLSQVVVGPGVRIAETLTIERAVLWEGARVDADVIDAVVTSRTIVDAAGRAH